MNKAADEDLVYRILKLECSLDAYLRVHAEEMDELKRCLAELKKEVLALHQVQQAKTETEVEI